MPWVRPRKDKKKKKRKKEAKIDQSQETFSKEIEDLKIKLSSFKGNKLQITEDKTDKLQYREINPALPFSSCHFRLSIRHFFVFSFTFFFCLLEPCVQLSL